MIIFKLKGGLGNQMFQYALAKKLVLEKNEEVLFDVLSYKRDRKRKFALEEFNIDIEKINNIKGNIYKLVTTIMRRLKINKFFNIIIERKNFELDLGIFEPNLKYYEGYWQNPKYFVDIRNLLIKDFTFRRSSSNNSVKKLFNTISKNESVSIHVRRGDYIDDKSSFSIYEIIDERYYYKAINYMREKYKNIKFFVFSDDIEYCKNMLKKEKDMNFVSEINLSPNEDFYLMKNCKHFIIANSTFSWWGAWLSDYENKIVIAPKNWYKDKKINNASKVLLCKDWIVLD